MMPKSGFWLITRLALAVGLLLPVSVMAKAPTCPSYEAMEAMLNSERIESCFGSYGVEVLKQEGQLRITNLYSLDEGSKITRTLAISEFADTLPTDLQPVYQAIREGASMGAALKASGWQVEKLNRHIAEVPAHDATACLSGWPEALASEELAVQVYELHVRRGDEVVRFALLAELHDPRYLDLEDLQELVATPVTHGDDAAAMNEIDSDTAAMLQQVSGLCAVPQ